MKLNHPTNSIDTTNAITPISAILFIPSKNVSKINSYTKRLIDIMSVHDIPNTKPIITSNNTCFDISSINQFKILIFGWGAEGKPPWRKILGKLSFASINHFFGFDLNEKTVLGDSYFLISPELARTYWGKKVQRGQQILYADGYYLRCTAPYGLEKEQIVSPQDKKSRRKLVPGDLEKVEIVRLIFNLYVNHDYTVAKICNLLSSQQVESPGTSKHWTWSNVKKLLENYAYIGANQFLQNIQLDAFQGIVDKFTFFSAQAKLHQEYPHRHLYLKDNYK